MNVKPRFSLQVPPQFVNVFQRFLFCFTYILSGDVSHRIEGRQRRSVIEALRLKT